VGAIAQLATRYADGFSVAEIPGFLMLLVPVWWAWVGQTFYLTRFDSDDIAQRLFTLVQMVPVAAMAAFIPTGLESGATGYALSYAAIRFILIVQYARVLAGNPLATGLIHRYIGAFSLGMSLWILSIFVPSEWRYVLWISGLLIDFAGPLTVKELQAKFPPHLHHVPERFGLFTIVNLGEGIIAIIAGYGKGNMSGTSLLGGFFGVLITFALWWDYFESAKAAEGRNLDGLKGVNRFQIWLYLHLPLVASIIMTAIIVKKGVAGSWSQAYTLEQGFMLSGSVGLATLVIAMIQLTSPIFECSPRIRREIKTRVWLSVATASLGLVSPVMKPVGFLALIAAMACCQIAISVRQTPGG
jgi:low temperature requirement protein LtrA